MEKTVSLLAPPVRPHLSMVGKEPSQLEGWKGQEGILIPCVKPQ